ncbi:MAG: hypothetical protein HYU27_03965 [Acidobacteria bacterium]|nr:hypothetical protein [Acidobacteriota bacterium]
MPHLAKVSLWLAIAVALHGSPLSAAPNDYFTEAELDLIRDAQELKFRVPIYFKLAERRLIFLGVMEKSEKEKEKERKDREKWEKEQKKGAKPGPAGPAPVDELAYLDAFTSSELFRGYMQALEEVMENIDDAYGRKLDVRDSQEDLEKFTRDTIPLLQKYKPRNAADRAAWEEAIEKARESQTAAKDALKIVPKTEKKRQQQ